MPLMDSLLQKNLEVEYKKGSRKGQKDRHSYDIIFNEMTEDGRQSLFEQFHSQYQAKEILLRCRCNPNETIYMGPVKRRGTYYIRTLHRKKNLHMEGCNFEGGKQSNYHTNWLEDESTGIIRVRFKDSFTIEKNEQGPSPNMEEDGGEGERLSRERKNTYNRITLYAFFMRLLLDAWNVKMRTYIKDTNNGKTSSYPDLTGLYKSIESHWAIKIVFGQDH